MRCLWQMAIWPPTEKRWCCPSAVGGKPTVFRGKLTMIGSTVEMCMSMEVGACFTQWRSTGRCGATVTNWLETLLCTEATDSEREETDRQKSDRCQWQRALQPLPERYPVSQARHTHKSEGGIACSRYHRMAPLQVQNKFQLHPHFWQLSSASELQRLNQISSVTRHPAALNTKAYLCKWFLLLDVGRVAAGIRLEIDPVFVPGSCRCESKRNGYSVNPNGANQSLLHLPPILRQQETQLLSKWSKNGKVWIHRGPVSFSEQAEVGRWVLLRCQGSISYLALLHLS